ncbi:MAG: FAD-dependent oxidoreductase [Myxococcales bacterium]|nr:FAD-dependent oxidoreductase [Myxococcales bacterium]
MSAIRPTRPRRLDEVSSWQLETDVAIVGFGGAGACAALEAHDAGAEVAIFEVSAASGGSTALSSAEIYMGGGGGTRVQRACGYDDSTEAMFAYLMAAQGPLADEERIRLYCEGSLAHFDWLVGLGVPYKDTEYKERAMMALTDDCLLYTGSEKAWPFREIAKPCPRGHNLEIEGDNGGPLFMSILTRQVEARPRIRVEYNARALTLIQDETGRVHGLVVRIDGEERNVRARRGVVLCAGGFVMNREMLGHWAPEFAGYTAPVGNPFDDGSGIRMGQGAGAALLHMDECFLTIPFYPPASHTKGILVNAQGQRFLNEDVYHARVAAFARRQLGSAVYLIVGEKNFVQPNMLGGEIAAVADSIEELAGELGLPVENLVHTVRHYNEHAAKGEDPLFHKQADWLEPIEPTFAAIDITPGRHGNYVAFTLGGLDTKPSGEVLTMDGEPIPGLFAAGRTTCGVPRRAEGYASGLSVGDVTFFGRLAGRTAATAT